MHIFSDILPISLNERNLCVKKVQKRSTNTLRVLNFFSHPFQRLRKKVNRRRTSGRMQLNGRKNKMKRTKKTSQDLSLRLFPSHILRLSCLLLLHSKFPIVVCGMHEKKLKEKIFKSHPCAEFFMIDRRELKV
jgi:hypothetical protein